MFQINVIYSKLFKSLHNILFKQQNTQFIRINIRPPCRLRRGLYYAKGAPYDFYTCLYLSAQIFTRLVVIGVSEHLFHRRWHLLLLTG